MYPTFGKPRNEAIESVFKNKTDQLETTDLQLAQRAQRLQELFVSEVWNSDVLPILHSLYDDFLQDVLRKEADPDVLKGLEELINRLQGTVRLGYGALERIANRRLKASMKKESLEQHLPLQGFTLPANPGYQLTQ